MGVCGDTGQGQPAYAARYAAYLLRPRLVDSRTEFPRTEASVRGKSVREIVAGKGSHAFFSAHRTFPCAERGARTKSSAHGGVRARTLSRVPRTAIGRPPTAMAGKRKPAGEPTERMKAPKEWSSLENVAVAPRGEKRSSNGYL